MPDWMPSQDSDFNGFANTFVTYGAANATALGLTTAQTGALNAALTAWLASYPAYLAGDQAQQGRTATKKTDRGTLEGVLRQIGGELQKRESVTDAQRQAIGLPVHDTTKTPVAAITTKPLLKIETDQRLRHTIRFTDEATPTSRAKPKGAIGLELWMKRGGAAPTGIGECEPLGLITNSPDVEEFEPADGGKTIHYLARWQTTRGDKGPFSATASATVGA